MILPPPRRATASRLGAYAPVPFAGAAAILVALIVFTPVLLASGPSALAVQAELVVYRVQGGTTTEFYLHAVGSDVPYARIDLDLGTGFLWDGSCPTSGITWSNTSLTDVLSVSNTSLSAPVLVNASATYNASGRTSVYAAELALNVDNLGSSSESLAIVPCPAATPGESVPSSWLVSNLPLALLLVDYGSGGPP